MLQGGIMEILTAFKNQNFRYLYCAEFISSFGSKMYTLALTLIIFNVTGSALDIAKMLFLSMLPAIIISPYLGSILDGKNRRHVISLLNILKGAIVLLVLVLNSTILLYFIIFVSSVIDEISRVSYKSFLPDVVEEDKLLHANSILGMTGKLSRILGPLLGGILISAYGINSVIIINSLSYFFAALLIGGLLKTKSRIESKRTNGSRFLDGLKYLRDSKVISKITLSNGLLSFVIAGNNIAIVILVSKIFQDHANGLGIVNSALAVGMLIGTISVQYITRRISLEKSSLLGVLFLGISLLLMGIVNDMNIIVVIRVISGFFVIVYNLSMMTLIQKIVSPDFRMRIFSTMNSFESACGVTGLLIFGYLIDTLGVSAIYIMMGFALMLSSFLWYGVKMKSETNSITQEEEAI